VQPLGRRRAGGQFAAFGEAAEQLQPVLQQLQVEEFIQGIADVLGFPIRSGGAAVVCLELRGKLLLKVRISPTLGTLACLGR